MKRLLIVMVFVVGVHLNIEFMLSLVQCCETPTHINIELKLRILAYLIERGKGKVLEQLKFEMKN